MRKCSFFRANECISHTIRRRFRLMRGVDRCFNQSQSIKQITSFQEG